MSTAKQLMHNSSKYFDELPKSTQEIVKEAILKAATDRNGPECYKSEEHSISSIECLARDGFIPFNSNKGGLVYQNFTTLSEYWGGGYVPQHKGAAKEIQRQIDMSFDQVADYMVDNIGKQDMEKYFSSDKSKVNYRNISELQETLEKQDQTESAKKVSSWVSQIQDIETECLGNDESSIMHEIQFKYEGKNAKGLQVAYISATLNTEGPYHRSSMPWAPEVFCEASEGVEITWRNNAELKRKLAKAFAKVTKSIF